MIETARAKRKIQILSIPVAWWHCRGGCGWLCMSYAAATAATTYYATIHGIASVIFVKDAEIESG